MGQIESSLNMIIKFRETWSASFDARTIVREVRDSRCGVDHGVVDSEKFSVAS